MVECQDCCSLPSKVISLTHGCQWEQTKYPDVPAGLFKTTSTRQFSFRQPSQKKEKNVKTGNPI